MDEHAVRKALEAICYAIEDTGGVQWNDDRLTYCPYGAREWPELGEAYRLACVALVRPMQVVYEDDDIIP